MVHELKTLPLGISLGFYDGVTEGFATDLLDGMPGYFDTVAWDSGQDERLFAAVKVDRSSYAKLINSLRAAGETSTETKWLSTWEFSDSRDQVEAEELLRSCRGRLSQEGALLFTPRIAVDPARVFTMDADLKLLLEDVLLRGTPDDLELWMRHLET